MAQSHWGRSGQPCSMLLRVVTPGDGKLRHYPPLLKTISEGVTALKLWSHLDKFKRSSAALEKATQGDARAQAWQRCMGQQSGGLKA